MPALDHATFIDRLKGKSIDLAGLHGAYPDLGVEADTGLYMVPPRYW